MHSLTAQPVSGRRTTFILSVPVFVGGWLAVLFGGAWDYVPWLTSPFVIAGLAVTVVAGLVLLQRNAIRPRQMVAAVVIGLIGFGVGLPLVMLVVLAVWFRPGGPVVP